MTRSTNTGGRAAWLSVGALLVLAAGLPAACRREPAVAPAPSEAGAPSAAATVTLTPSAAGSPLPEAAAVECQTDADCACGVRRGTGECAFGPAPEIDTSRQCPDFCGGITGKGRISCREGRCVQDLGGPSS